jgi:hypothetical protein
MPGVMKATRIASVYIDAIGREFMQAEEAIRANLATALNDAGMNGMVADSLSQEQAAKAISALSIFIHDMNTPDKDLPDV